MLKDSDYIRVHLHETIIGTKPLGIKIYVAVGRELSDHEQDTIERHAEDIFKELHKGHVLDNPEAMERGEKERKEIMALFDEPIYAEEIPNEYCKAPCCILLPWFIVTTKIGRIKIGWRKRVISIDWENTLQKKNARELFPDEDVTKENYLIHAWSYADAKKYLDIIHA